MKPTMLERWTAFLAQSAATVLVLTGLVVLLAFTHMKTYRAGYCAAGGCDASGQVEIRPAARDRQDRTPQRRLAQVETAEPRTGTVLAAVTQPSVPGITAGVQSGSGQDSDSQQVPGNRPGAQPSGPPRPARRTQAPGEDICFAAPATASDQDIARCWLRIGDAYQAVDMDDQAREAWDQALLIGSEVGGAQASLMAQQRLQGSVLARSCRATEDSLARIANGYDRGDINGEIIQLRHRQGALAALGYYSDTIDGEYGPATRRAVRDFQSDMGFDETGALNPQETVDLICHAAITARDSGAQNLLGIMFATGLGVELNVDMATEWLEIAATRGHDGANFNLALIYGTGTIEGSYRLCGVVESPERADSYLRRAAELGHGRAAALRQHRGSRGGPAERWQGIAERLSQQARQSEDRFFLAWERRLVEARREARNGAIQPGCYLDNGTDYTSPASPAR
jgi:TPR repeat protein